MHASVGILETLEIIRKEAIDWEFINLQCFHGVLYLPCTLCNKLCMSLKISILFGVIVQDNEV
ncbi:hypothetical protein BRADI_5g13199v3 [Brachypodium distachyon]|uniref:Uncharacterized protein n=1 Tax=Brachypodium distachyon TaxID=15368 RepID=A0A2K2CGZ1_BRADI|nr:hypothetical protein BRADI_5g13199v3 [Brachypodium distachyon]